MKNIIFAVLFLGLTCFVIFLFRQNKVLLDANEAFRSFCDNNIGAITEQEYRNMEIESKGNLLPDIKLINQEGDTVLVSEILKERTLFFIFSSNQCNSCVNTQLEIIKSKQIDSHVNLVIVSDYRDLRDLMIFKRYNKLKGELYVYRDLIPLNVSKAKQPFYFILDKNRVVNNVFISRKENMHSTDLYLNFILRSSVGNAIIDEKI